MSGSAIIFGDPKVGKSLLILSLAEAIADQTIPHYLGIAVPKHGRVLYIQLDTPRSLWTNYLSVIHSSEARGNIFLIDREMPDLPKGFDIRIKACNEWLRQEVESIEPVLVVVDTVRRMHRGDENDSTQISAVHDAFVEATQPAALLYITHKRKQQQGEFGPGTVRGQSAFSGAVDALINMTKAHLRFEARSDVEEEIAIFQNDDGTFSLNSKEDELGKFMAEIDPSLPKGEVDQMIADHFGVTTRTAKRYRAAMARERAGER